MTHCVNFSVPSLFKFYIEDEKCEMTDAQVVAKAREAALKLNEVFNPEDVGLIRDEEMEIEPDDIKIGDMYSF